MKKKLNHIAFLQFYTILLFIVGIIHYGNTPLWFIRVSTFIHSFHIPFIFAYFGYLWNLGLEKRNAPYPLKKTIKQLYPRLLLPYLTINLIAFPIKALLANFAYRPVNFSFCDLFMSLIYPEKGAVGLLELLPTLFIVHLIALVVLNKKHNLKTIYLFSFIFLTISIVVRVINIENNYRLFNWNKGLIFFVYFVFVFLLFEYKELFKRMKNKPVIALLLYSLVGISIFFPQYQVYWEEVKAIPGIIASFILAHSLESIVHSYIIKNIRTFYYQIFLLAWFPLSITRIVLFDRRYISFPYIIAVTISLVLAIGLPIVAGKILKGQNIFFVNKLLGL